MSDLIYVIGSGRSGTTVIERILQTAPCTVAVGEVHALWRLPIDELVCSCGTPVPECRFWQDVLSHAAIGADELEQLSALEDSVVRNTYLMKLRYDLERIAADQDLATFIDLQKRLFDAVRAVSGAKIVIDSSKAGPRGWVLAAAFEPVFLHSYRGAEDVIASWRRPKFDPSTNAPMKKPPIRSAALDWIKVEQAVRSLGKVSDVQRVDYRDFSARPKSALKDALDASFPGLVDSVAWTGQNRVRPPQDYHSVLGNPDRFSREDIEIRPHHASDRSKFSAPERFVIRSIGRSLELLYR